MYKLSELAQQYNFRITIDDHKEETDNCCLWWSGHAPKRNNDLAQLGAALQSSTKNNSSFSLKLDLR